MTVHFSASKLWMLISFIIKNSCIARGVVCMFFLLEAAHFSWPEIERDYLFKPLRHARFELSYQQFTSQVPQRVRKRQNSVCQGKAV